MHPKQPPALKPPSLPVGLFLMAALFAVAGWAAVASIVLLTLPFLFPRWLF